MKKKILTPLETGVAIIIILILAWVFIPKMLGSRSENNLPIVGDAVLLFHPGKGSSVILSVTKEGYDDINKFSLAKDYEGMKQMIADDKAFMVDSGTQAKMLAYDKMWGELYEVKIMSGSYAGKSGFVLRTATNKIN